MGNGFAPPLKGNKIPFFYPSIILKNKLFNGVKIKISFIIKTPSKYLNTSLLNLFTTVENAKIKSTSLTLKNSYQI